MVEMVTEAHRSRWAGSEPLAKLGKKNNLIFLKICGLTIKTHRVPKKKNA